MWTWFPWKCSCQSFRHTEEGAWFHLKWAELLWNHHQQDTDRNSVEPLSAAKLKNIWTSSGFKPFFKNLSQINKNIVLVQLWSMSVIYNNHSLWPISGLQCFQSTLSIGSARPSWYRNRTRTRSEVLSTTFDKSSPAESSRSWVSAQIDWGDTVERTSQAEPSYWELLNCFNYDDLISSYSDFCQVLIDIVVDGEVLMIGLWMFVFRSWAETNF